MTNQYLSSLQDDYRKSLWAPFRKAITDYQLIEDGDHIAVCISGGKDSMIMGLLFEKLLAHRELDIKVTHLVMNPGYHDTHLQQLKSNAQKLGLALEIFDINVFEQITEAKLASKQCYLCARKRRGHLYNKAQQLGCNKIALGHHQDDLLETLLMNLLFKGTYATLMPKIRSKNFTGLELIRPLIQVEEQAIIDYANQHHLEFLRCACPHENRQEELGDRQKAREILNQLLTVDPRIKASLLHSQSSVNLEQVLQTKNKETKVHFLDNY